MKTKLWYKGPNGDIVATPFKDILAIVSGKTKTEAEYLKEFIQLAIDGKEDPVMDESTGYSTAAQIKSYKAAWKMIQDIVSDHKDHQSELDKTEAKRQDSLKKQGEEISLAEIKAGVLVDKSIVETGVENIQAAMGDKFVVTSTGITGAEGATITKTDLLDGVAFLAKSGNGLDKLKTSLTWGFGDVIILAAASLFTGKDGKVNQDDLDDFVAQLSEETGRAAHTVRQAQRVAEYFDNSTPARTRYEALSFTHHQEAFNYMQGLDPAKKETKGMLTKIGELMVKACTAGGTKTVKPKVGKAFEVSKPMPTSEFRAEVRKIVGLAEDKKAAPEGDAAEESDKVVEAKSEVVHDTPSFIYINSEGEAFKSAELNMEAVKAGTFPMIIDLKLMAVVDQENVEQATEIPDLE